jgi:aminoglycoside phosphotransferase (APT) family kinase protein
MLQSLPADIRRKLVQTLDQWPQWSTALALTHAPNIVRVMTSGVSNFSILVESQQQFVVRIDGINPVTHGLCRQTEWRTLEVANARGLSPRPCYFNPGLGSLVCAYLPPDTEQRLCTADVAQLLRDIHALPARHYRLNLDNRVMRYTKLLEQQGRAQGNPVLSSRKAIASLLQQVASEPQASVLCHNDLLHANRLYSAGKLWAIDWEYCAMGSRWYDVAVILNGDDLPIDSKETLLHDYLGRRPDDSERRAVHRYGCIYRYLELLWYLTLETPVLDQLTIESKRDALEQMLDEALD